jgi:hypothetical protein
MKVCRTIDDLEGLIKCCLCLAERLLGGLGIILKLQPAQQNLSLVAPDRHQARSALLVGERHVLKRFLSLLKHSAFWHGATRPNEKRPNYS